MGARGSLGPALLAVLGALAGCAAPGPQACEGTFEAAVVRVVDGDTLDVQGCPRIRLALVDTPERGERGFDEATAFTAALCPVGGRATVDRDSLQPWDTSGQRMVAKVLCGGANLNAELLRAGHAVVLTRFCGSSEFAREPWAAPHCAP